MDLRSSSAGAESAYSKYWDEDTLRIGILNDERDSLVEMRFHLSL